MEGVLDSQAREELEQHIPTCPACTAALKDFSYMQEIVSDSMNPATTGPQAVSKAIGDMKLPVSKAISPIRWWIPILRYSTAAAIFLVVGLFLGSLGPTAPQADRTPLAIAVAQLQGDVLVKHAWENRWKKITAEEPIYQGDAFRSLHQASLVLSLDPNSTVVLNENSSLDLLEFNGQTEFEITYGTVKATLEGPHDPFFISTPQGRFEALGTEFIVRVR